MGTQSPSASHGFLGETLGLGLVQPASKKSISESFAGEGDARRPLGLLRRKTYPARAKLTEFLETTRLGRMESPTNQEPSLDAAKFQKDRIQ